ncbi:MAG: hypothetical protein JO334_09000 [Verrucomicrobia bacterium]|nr:hypothetical protein [Verrucomicrobiota bacterium]
MNETIRLLENPKVDKRVTAQALVRYLAGLRISVTARFRPTIVQKR